MARYWVGGSGNINDTAHWSDTSGGTGGFSLPTSTDNVYFNSASASANYTVALNAAWNTQNLTITAPATGNITFSGTTGYVSVYGDVSIYSGAVTFQDLSNYLDVRMSKTSGNQNVSIQSTIYKISTRDATCTLTNNLRTTLFVDSFQTFTPNGYKVTIDGTASGNTYINGNGTINFYDLEILGIAQKTYSFSLYCNVTCSNNITITGNSVLNRLFVKSDTKGVQRTITAASVTVSNADFQDIVGAGAGSWNLSNITGKSGDCGGNSGITFTTGTTTNWVSGTTWSTATWSVRVPLPQDTATFTTATAVTLVQDMPRIGGIDFTGSNNNKNFNATGTCSFYGSLNMTGVSTISLTGTATYTYEGRGTSTITSAGKQWAKSFVIDAPGGTLQLGDNFNNTGASVNAAFTLTRGTFLKGSYDMKVGYFTTNNSNTRTLNLGSGTLECTVTNTSAFTIQTTTGLTFDGGTCTIKISGARLSEQAAFYGGSGLTFYNLWIASTGTYSESINMSSTFNDIKINAGRTVKFQVGTTQTVNTFTAVGSAGNLITLDSTTTGTYALAKAGGGKISCDYLSIQHCVASPANTWYAGLNSTNNQSVATAGSGWLFEVPVMILYKTVSEVISVVSSVKNRAQKKLGEAVSVVSSILSGFKKYKVVSESVSIVSSFIKSTGKPIKEAITAVSSMGHIGSFYRSITNAIALSETFSKIRTRYCQLIESITATDSIARRINRRLSESITISLSFLKNTARALRQAIAISEVFAKIIIKFKILNDTITVVSTLKKKSIKTFAESIAIAQYFAKIAYKRITNAITVVQVFAKARVKVFTQTIAVVDKVAKSTRKALAETIALVSSLPKYLARILTKETITVTGAYLRMFIRSVTNSISISETFRIVFTVFTIREVIAVSEKLTRSLSRTIAEAITLAERMTRGFFYKALGVISVADTIKKSPMKLLNEILALNRSFSMKLNGILLDLWSKATNLSKSWNIPTKSISDAWTRASKTITDPWKRTPKN